MNILLASQSLYQFIGTSAMGLIIFLTLVLTKHKWVNTLTYFITFLTLSPITFVITKVISNNLALSLGMVGALSIVRFRNPVKSPLELVMYFALITIGISMGVNFFWSVALLLAIILILVFSFLLDTLSKKFNFDLFNYSFTSNDAVNYNIVEIEALKKLEDLENNKNLIYFSKVENSYIYKLSLKSADEANNIKNIFEKNKDVKTIEINFYS
jgi:uncharacterized membrane protein YhiD involved in acid resistance|tara:strand:+ start:2078 stop:2716 length:639 start_codon:yes stop_codon:yes gene_type:complete